MYFYNLISDYKKGDRKSLEVLINDFNPLIKKMSKDLHYEEGCTDLIIFFIELMGRIDFTNFRVVTDSIIISYIQRYLKNKTIDLCRERIRKNIDFIDIELEEVCEDESSIELDVCFKEYVSERFSGVQKDVIIFKYIKGYSDVEISEKLKISRQAVNSAKNRALKKVKDDYMDVV